MKIKKHLVAAALAVGLAGSATGMGTEAVDVPDSAIGLILAWKYGGGMPTDFVSTAGHVAATAAGAAVGGWAVVATGAKIGGSFGAFIGGPVGLAGGAAAGAV